MYKYMYNHHFGRYMYENKAQLVMCFGMIYMYTGMHVTSLVPRHSNSDLEEGLGGTPGKHCRAHAFNFKPVIKEETQDDNFQYAS